MIGTDATTRMMTPIDSARLVGKQKVFDIQTITNIDPMNHEKASVGAGGGES